MNWYIRATDSLTPTEYTLCLQMMTPARRKAVEGMSSAAPQTRTILGEWMTKCALSDLTGQPIEQIRLERDAKGKPTAPATGLHVSISHSDRWVVCAVSDQPVGIDIEKLRPLRPGIENRFCTPEDLADLAAAPNEEQRQQRMIRLWSAKEAWFKCTGQPVHSSPWAVIAPHCRQLLRENYVISIVEEY